MTLLKRNLHVNCPERVGEVQLALEEDYNLPETKPDVSTICFEKGEVVIEEVRPVNDAVAVKGRLAFSVLYHTQENGGKLERTEGKIPFDEKIRMEGLGATDAVSVTGAVEDLTVTMINSRKLSVRSVLCLKACSDEMRDEEIPVGIAEEDERLAGAQIQKDSMEFTQLCACKKDLLRVKEELILPSGYPNIGRILWKNVSLGEMNFRLGEEKLYVQGEAKVFVLYEGESGEETPQVYETVTQISSEMACSGCHEGMAVDVRYGIAQWELTPGPDLDGEQRDLSLELTIDLKVCVYSEERLEVMKDAYGVARELKAEKRTANLRELVRSVTGKTKVADHVKLEGEEKALQLVHGDAILGVGDIQARDGGITLRGSLGVKILYVTGDDEKPYGCLNIAIPFEYSMEIPGMRKEDGFEPIQMNVEQLSLTMLDGEEVDVKAILCFSVSVFRDSAVQVMEALNEEPLDREKMASLPGMVAYVVKDGEDLWSIGKRYYVPVQSLMEYNDLTSEAVTPGQKLLIVKES